MKFGLFSTDPELEKLQRSFAAGAVVSQTQYIFRVCKKGSYLSGSFVKPDPPETHSLLHLVELM